MSDTRYYGLMNWFVYGQSNRSPNHIYHISNYYVVGPWRALELAQEELDNNPKLRQQFIEYDVVRLRVQHYEDVATKPFLT